MNPRRIFLATALALVGLSRRAWAFWQPAQRDVAPTRWASLSRPIRIPADTVSAPWQPVSFVAEAFAQTPAGGRRRVLINGVVFRRHTDLSALCVTCPHEQCKVDFVADATPPLFECGCHASTFDASNDGAKISGETPRGLYRFRIAHADTTSVVITEIEEAALTEV